MSQLALTNVINISVSQPLAGAGEYNTSNLALFTDEEYDIGTFGTAGYKIYLGPTDVGTDFGTSSRTFKMANAVFSQKPNILAGGGYLVVIPLNSDTLGAAISRTQDLVQYFGAITTVLIGETDGLAAAAIVQPLNKMIFLAGRLTSDVDPGGYLDLLRTGGFTQSRGLYYGGTDEDSTVNMLASYAGRALSVNFDGSNTTSTMHLKDLLGVQPDPTMNQTLLLACVAAGADTYVSLQGVAKIFCSGKNSFFDQIYNELWFAGALQIAGFNFLAQADTKVPQTENGMNGLKNAYRQVCQQAVTNQYSAPGTWNSATTFGNQDDFFANISQRGYYIYSQPISQQSQAARATRAAPLIQIALKEAGAIHSSNVIVNINA